MITTACVDHSPRHQGYLPLNQNYSQLYWAPQAIQKSLHLLPALISHRGHTILWNKTNKITGNYVFITEWRPPKLFWIQNSSSLQLHLCTNLKNIPIFPNYCPNSIRIRARIEDWRSTWETISRDTVCI